LASEALRPALRRSAIEKYESGKITTRANNMAGRPAMEIITTRLMFIAGSGLFLLDGLLRRIVI
jgi:hypothetical protein